MQHACERSEGLVRFVGLLGAVDGKMSRPQSLNHLRSVLSMDFNTAQSYYQLFGRPREIATHLPLLEKLHQRAAPYSFNNFAFVFVQHFLAAFPQRLRMMMQSGLSPSDTWFLDIPYSTNDAVAECLGQLFPGRVPRRYTDPFGNYNHDQLQRMVEVARQVVAASAAARTVVVDDGAYFVRFLSHLLEDAPAMATQFQGLRIVEQTTRGHRFLESDAGQAVIRALGVTAVSVARAFTKTAFEAPFIGMAVADAVVDKLVELAVEPRRVLVLGFGSVGRAVALACRNRLSLAAVEIVEIDASKAQLASELGFARRDALDPSDARENYDLVVGCTGKRSFTPADRQILADGAILISASSAAVEFDRKNFVDQADADLHDDFWVETERTEDLPLHTDIVLAHSGGRRLTLANAGFPINFQGSLGVIPTALIEPTHCLLHAATLQAIEQARVGLSPLREDDDMWIYQEAMARLRRVKDGE